MTMLSYCHASYHTGTSGSETIHTINSNEKNKLVIMKEGNKNYIEISNTNLFNKIKNFDNITGYMNDSIEYNVDYPTTGTNKISDSNFDNINISELFSFLWQKMIIGKERYHFALYRNSGNYIFYHSDSASLITHLDKITTNENDRKVPLPDSCNRGTVVSFVNKAQLP